MKPQPETVVSQDVSVRAELNLRKLCEAPVRWILVSLIWAYRLILSPLLSGSCRYQPSCSRYAEEAIDKHGPFNGAILAFKRLLRCHPWGSFGSDPVP
ncbi:MAG: membrane protein insertion efficiency factor YidD [Candidatus Zixiibacteriota bacterium]